MAPTCSTQTLLLCSLVLLLTASWAAGFEYSGYCRKMCMWGRGGNLCKCSAVHFAGKRGRILSPEAGFPEGGLPGRVGDEAGEVEVGEAVSGRSGMERLIEILEKGRTAGEAENFMKQLQDKDQLQRLISLLLRKTTESP